MNAWQDDVAGTGKGAVDGQRDRHDAQDVLLEDEADLAVLVRGPAGELGGGQVGHEVARRHLKLDLADRLAPDPDLDRRDG